MMIITVGIVSLVLIVFFSYMLYRERRRTAQALEEREVVLDNINTAFIYLDNNYKVKWKSERAVGSIMSRVARYKKNKYCYETVKGLKEPCPNCPIVKMRQAGEPVDHMDDDDGYSVKIKTFPVRNNRGEITGSILQMADISQQIEQEKLLIEMKDRFQFSLIGGNLFAWELDLHTKQITGVVEGNSSQHFELDAYITTYIHPDYRELVWNELTKVFDHQSEYFDLQVMAQTTLTGMKDYEWMHIIGKAMLPDKNGYNTKIFGIQQIITEEKKRQIRLEEMYSQLSLMFKASHVSPWTLNLVTRQFSSTNSNVIEASGITIDQIMEYVHEDDRDSLLNMISQLYSGERNSLYIQLRCFLPEDDGNENWYEMSGLVFENDSTDKPLKVIGIRRNIMYLKHTDELIDLRNKAEASNKMKDAFLANMSHEIRTPLNAIVGFAQIIMELSNNKEELVDHYKIVESNSELLLQLINDILDLSRIETGQIEMSFTVFDVKSIFDNLYKVYERKVYDGVKLNLQLPESPCYINSDQKRLTQVISNFISNAIKYTNEGSITMGFSHNDNSLRFFVSDTGKGMAKENLPTVFDRFTKFDPFVQGVGLGLSICRSIIEALGGEIGVESELGKGSEFWFTIPLESKQVKDQ